MICFTWWGLTQYAARMIEAFNKATNEKLVVVATRPKSSPVKGMESILSCDLIWVDEDDCDVCSKLSEIPRILMVSNWNLTCWRGMMEETRKHGGKTVAMVDTNLTFGLKQILRALRFRLIIRKRFDAFFVVGESGRRLMRFWGVSNRFVYSGLYGADATLFSDGGELSIRPKRILYVGQFIARKNVLRLVDAFRVFHAQHPDWELEMCGHGPLHDQIAPMTGLIIHDFVQPEELSNLYRHARAFVLPSLEEHWGVVVHEAALSGCYLLLSKAVGARVDFPAPACGSDFSPLSKNSIVKAFEQLADCPVARMELVRQQTLNHAKNFGNGRFVSEMKSLCSELLRSEE